MEIMGHRQMLEANLSADLCLESWYQLVELRSGHSPVELDQQSRPISNAVIWEASSLLDW